MQPCRREPTRRPLARLIVLAALLAGCGDNQPTAVAPPRDAPPRDWTSQVSWRPVGGFDIPVPIEGVIPWTNTGITVNDTGWIHEPEIQHRRGRHVGRTCHRLHHPSGAGSVGAILPAPAELPRPRQSEYRERP
jgi:hypothetical protein